MQVGEVQGIFFAASPEEALLAFYRDVGYESQEAFEAVAGPFEGRILEDEEESAYRAVVGEIGTTGHVVAFDAATLGEANLALGRELARYAGNGWGQLEIFCAGDWYRIG